MTNDEEYFAMAQEWKPRFVYEDGDLKINKHLNTLCIVQLVFVIRRSLHSKHHHTQIL